MENKKYNPIGLLSNFQLKMIAIITMTIDHIGLVFFPGVAAFRIIGRLAFPIFAFLIAEGCSHTKNKLKRFLLMFAMGLIYLIVYYIYTKQIYGSIFLTFTFSIFFTFLLYDIKKVLFKGKYLLTVLLSILFASLLFLTYYIFKIIYIDYQFFGMLIPVFISIFNFRNIEVPVYLKKVDCIWTKLVCCVIGSIILSINLTFSGLQVFCLVSILLLALYNGNLGFKGSKYGFYIYYPVHLLIIEGLNLLI